MPVERIQFQQTIRTADDKLLFSDHVPGLDLDPPYQRGHVWRPEQRVAFIRTLLQGLPIGAIFLNRRDEWDQPIRVVDGKQRIVTLREWFAGGFAVPRDWFSDDDVHPGARHHANVIWSNLVPAAQRRFVNRTTLAVHETRLSSEADEADLYLRVNFGGVPQTAEDEARARRSAESEDRS